MNQTLVDLFFIALFFFLAVLISWLYIQYLKCRFKEIFQTKPQPVKVQPVFVIAEPVYETNEVALVV